MGVRNNERSIRVLAVYAILKSTSVNKPMTAKEILAELEKEYHIKSCKETLYWDINAIRLFEDIKAKPYKGYWIEYVNTPIIKTGDTFYSVYFNDDKKSYEIEELVAEEVSDKRVWTDNGLCEIGIDEFGANAFKDHNEADKACRKLNGGKNDKTYT